MRAFLVVIFQPLGGHYYGFLQIPGVPMQEGFMLVRSPEAFHDDVIGPTSLAIHADLFRVDCTGVAMGIQSAKPKLLFELVTFFLAYLDTITPMQHNRHTPPTQGCVFFIELLDGFF